MVPLLTAKQVAERLNCKTSCIYDWTKEGKIPAFKLNGLLRFDPREIEAWISQRRLKPFGTHERTRKSFNIKKKVEIDGIIEGAIESTLGPGYNTPQRGDQTDQAGKGGA